MSHTMNIQMEIHDLEALSQACNRLGLKTKIGTHYLFSGDPIVGFAVYLPNWRYPIVIKEDGSVSYDNFGGRWGDFTELHKLEAVYGVEKAIKEAQRLGYTCLESYDEVKKEIELQIIINE